MAQTSTNCWACGIVLSSISIVQQTVSILPQQLATQLWPLMVTLVSFSVIWDIGKALIVGYSPILPAIQAGIRAAVLGSLLAAPSDLGSLTSQFLVLPALETGSSLGAMLQSSTATALGISAPTQSCTGASPASAGITDPDYVTAATSVMTILCQIQTVSMITYDIGTIIASQQMRSGTGNDLRLSVFYAPIGLLMMYTSFTMLLDFAVTLFETILRLGVFMTFIPFIAFFWIYPSLRGSVYKAFTNLMFVFVYLVFSGIAASVSASIMYTGMQLGLGLPAGQSDPTSIITAFSNMVSTGSTINDSATIALAMKFIAYATVCTSIAMGLQRGIHGLAMQVTQYSGAGNGDRSMAIAAMSSINSLAAIGLSGAAGGMAGLGRVAGRMAGVRKRTG